MEFQTVAQMFDAAEIVGTAAPHHAMYAIALGEQQFSKITAVLAGDARDQRSLGHPGSYKSAGYTSRESRWSMRESATDGHLPSPSFPNSCLGTQVSKLCFASVPRTRSRASRPTSPNRSLGTRFSYLCSSAFICG